MARRIIKLWLFYPSLAQIHSLFAFVRRTPTPCVERFTLNTSYRHCPLSDQSLHFTLSWCPLNISICQETSEPHLLSSLSLSMFCSEWTDGSNASASLNCNSCSSWVAWVEPRCCLLIVSSDVKLVWWQSRVIWLIRSSCMSSSAIVKMVYGTSFCNSFTGVVCLVWAVLMF